ncbi:MAG: hypothetical protein CO170_00935 [candidate division SR1 bacterium CG_4_9_14_3_um_filter_40_9]|nr:MAG: hypothetical protein CO170_00935 [candidate division SR1 bacterium CG_4_9_14_3_um_filter_40_9]
MVGLHGVFYHVFFYSEFYHQSEYAHSSFVHRYFLFFQWDDWIYFYEIKFFKIFFGSPGKFRSEIHAFLKDLFECIPGLSISKCRGQGPVKICDDVKMFLAIMSKFFDEFVEPLWIGNKYVGHRNNLL